MRPLAHLIRIYEIISKEEQNLLQAYNQRVRFYIGLITAIFAGTIAGLIKATLWYHSASLIVGPVLLIVIARIAREDTERAYAVWLSGITSRAKIEDEIGLTKPRENQGAYWSQEPIISSRYLEARSKDKDSKEFESKRLPRGHHKWARVLLDVFIISGIVGLIGISALTWSLWSLSR